MTHLFQAACLTAFAAAAHAMPAEQLYKKLSPSIWLVTTTDDMAKPLSTGSAVVIGRETLVTNCHVLRGASRVQVRHENTTQGATLEFPDPERDLCQLHVVGLNAPAVQIAPSSQLMVGQKVYAIGAPLGLEATLSDGLISALRVDPQGALQYIQTSAPVSPGSSGGGLFNEDGGLVGITTLAYFGNSQNLNFARPATLINDLPARGAAALASWHNSAPQVAPGATAASSAASSGSAVAVVPPSPDGVYPMVTADALLNLPFRTPRMQEQLERYLKARSPKYFAIDDAGHFGWANGTIDDPGQPKDPLGRAMNRCRGVEKRTCVLFAVDQKLVYGKH